MSNLELKISNNSSNTVPSQSSYIFLEESYVKIGAKILPESVNRKRRKKSSLENNYQPASLVSL